MEQRDVSTGDGVLTALQGCTIRAKGPESDIQVQLHWKAKLFAERGIRTVFPVTQEATMYVIRHVGYPFLN